MAQIEPPVSPGMEHGPVDEGRKVFAASAQRSCAWSTRPCAVAVVLFGRVDPLAPLLPLREALPRNPLIARAMYRRGLIEQAVHRRSPAGR